MLWEWTCRGDDDGLSLMVVSVRFDSVRIVDHVVVSFRG